MQLFLKIMRLGLRFYLLYYSNSMRINIGALTCDFLQCGILTSVDSDEPVQPLFMLRNSK